MALATKSAPLWFGAVTLSLSSVAFGYLKIQLLTAQPVPTGLYERLATELDKRTTIQLAPAAGLKQEEVAGTPHAIVWAEAGLAQDKELGEWLSRGGFLIIDQYHERTELAALAATWFPKQANEWRSISPSHEVMQSFYLLKSLPSCGGNDWQFLLFDQRTAVIASPASLLQALQTGSYCGQSVEAEKLLRLVVNLFMAATTMDYKKEQTHLDEILKKIL